MAKRNRNLNAASMEKRLSEGRGLGRGADYKPWLRIHDVGSIGISTRIKGWTTLRAHHLLSRLETSYFFVLDWSKKISDIREQFPLLPIEETIAIADRLGVRHPTDPQTQCPAVMTTDFRLTVVEGMKERDVARTVKPSTDLASTRVVEKFAIEREFWKVRNVDWGIISEDPVTEIIADNVRWLHNFYDLPADLSLAENGLEQIENFLIPLISSETPLSRATSECDDRLGLAPGTALSAVRHIIATRRWVVDMKCPIDPSSPLIFTVLPSAVNSTLDAA